ncbi:hypothetical protein RQP53_03525 [Paucibacter sp. APW11]|uniref:Uncharacterized protein n=1 Tax=Roseateles aquae TaxID=3077235 RepID=A0ABU3P6Y8_9BURK|nr:hypothetical protein [Paucibacter sp. APW11]
MSAAGLVIGIQLLSLHAGGGDLRTLTPGAYVQLESGATAGVYLNSHGRRSVFAGWTLEQGRWALTVGGVSGYPKAPAIPMLVPSYRLDSGLRIGIVPNPFGASVLHFSYEVRR